MTITPQELDQVQQAIAQSVLMAAALGIGFGVLLGMWLSSLPMWICREWRRYRLLRRVRISMPN